MKTEQSSPMPFTQKETDRLIPVLTAQQLE